MTYLHLNIFNQKDCIINLLQNNDYLTHFTSNISLQFKSFQKLLYGKIKFFKENLPRLLAI